MKIREGSNEVRKEAETADEKQNELTPEEVSQVAGGSAAEHINEGTLSTN